MPSKRKKKKKEEEKEEEVKEEEEEEEKDEEKEEELKIHKKPSQGADGNISHVLVARYSVRTYIPS